MNYDDLAWRLRGIAEAYPEDVFSPLTDEEKAIHASLITRTSAQMGRHLGRFFIEAADAIQELQRDAMRYEALRNQVCSDISVCRGVERHDATELFDTELDAAIDEAMQHEA